MKNAKKIFCKLQNTQREIFAVGDDVWDRGRATRGGVWDERGRSLDRAFGEGRSNIYETILRRAQFEQK